MYKQKNKFWISAEMCAIAVLSVGFAATPAVAQTKPALVRDADNPALQPFRAFINISAVASDSSKIVNGPVVPAGKRLVIENVSVWGLTHPSDGITGLWLGVKNTDVFAMMDPTPAESKTLDPASSISAYNRLVKLYFNPGETIQAWAFFKSTTSAKTVNLYLNGYYVNLP